MAEARADWAPVELAANGDVAEDDHDAEDEEDEEEADEEENPGAAVELHGAATDDRDDHEGEADVERGPAKGGYANVELPLTATAMPTPRTQNEIKSIDRAAFPLVFLGSSVPETSSSLSLIVKAISLSTSRCSWLLRTAGDAFENL